MSTSTRKEVTSSSGRDKRQSSTAITVHQPLTVENFRGEIWRTIQDARTGAISIVNAAVIARLAHALMQTYRVVPEVDEGIEEAA